MTTICDQCRKYSHIVEIVHYENATEGRNLCGPCNEKRLSRGRQEAARRRAR